MSEPEASPLFDETDRLVLRYSSMLTLENRVPDDLYNALAASFSKDELVELCFTVGLSNLVNRVHATFLTDLDGSTRTAAGDVAFCPIGH
ncbi:MAG: carboxymuconolactone decarboxylase family protein [Gammaproteobacteria bacterium]